MSTDLVPVKEDSTSLDIYLNESKFNQLQRGATMLANSGMVPDAFKKNVAACAVGLEMALRMGVHPLTLIQNLHVIHGKPGLSASFAVAAANASGVFSGPIEYELSGEGMARQCVATAVLARSRKAVSMTVSMEIAKKEGWLGKSGSKWQTMPDLMLQYRSASWLIRVHAPEILFGLQTSEEVIDITPSAKVTTIESAFTPAPVPVEPEEAPEPPKKTTKKATPKKEPVKKDAPKCEVADVLGSMEALIDKHKINNGMFRVYVAKVLGGPHFDTALWTLEQAKKVYDYIADMKGEDKA